jgi:acyl phosphate:glycerol-3-phosphate acyltransferase
MNALLQIVPFALLGYLLGSLPFAVLVSRAFGLADPRSHGSGNPGATNVLRTGNKFAALLTLLGDALKGWLAVWLAGILGADPLGIAVAGVTAFLGHIFPVFLSFKGGKGVATALGVLAGFHPLLALVAMVTWLVVALVTRYSSAAAIAAALEAPFVASMLSPRIELTVASAVMSGLLIWRHRGNIQRLLNGTESRIGSKKKETTP